MGAGSRTIVAGSYSIRSTVPPSMLMPNEIGAEVVPGRCDPLKAAQESNVAGWQGFPESSETPIPQSTDRPLRT